MRRVPLHLLDGIVAFGSGGASPELLAACGDRNVSISFLGRTGRFLARLEGPTSGNVLLRRAQYRAADDPGRRTAIARNVVLAKLVNARRVLQRGLRDHPERTESAAGAVAAMARSLAALERATDVDVVRGIEGDAARTYFGVFGVLVTHPDPAFRFRGRTRRPPQDPVNAMLSFAYTLLCHDIRSALETVGLDPQVGYLHTDRPGRPSLALDLMEELRPMLCDRLVLSLINRRQIAPDDFEVEETGGVYMKEDARKTLLASWHRRKEEQIEHPFLGERCTIGLIPHIQARLLARHLRGDLDAYPPFFWR